VRFLASLVVALAALGCPAQAQNLRTIDAQTWEWKRIGGWTIWIDRSHNGCFVYSSIAGPQIYIGYDAKREMGLALYNDAWKSLTVGTDYAMTVRIDDRSHEASLNAHKMPDGGVILRWQFTDAALGRQVLQDFQRGNRLSVIFNGRQLATYALVASQVAGDELLRCQAAMDRMSPPAAAKPVAPDEDPFKKGGGSPAGRATGDDGQKRRD